MFGKISETIEQQIQHEAKFISESGNFMEQRNPFYMNLSDEHNLIKYGANIKLGHFPKWEKWKRYWIQRKPITQYGTFYFEIFMANYELKFIVECLSLLEIYGMEIGDYGYIKQREW